MVDHIEIIRGTSGELDVRGSTQIINIVLHGEISNTSLFYEANENYYHNGELKPGGQLSYSGQAGKLNFLVSGSAVPEYEYRILGETSALADGTLNDQIDEDRITDQTTYTLSTNLDYQFNDQSSLRFNALYSELDNPRTLDRTTVNLRDESHAPYVEREDTPGQRSNWEIGGDYEYLFNNGHRFKLLGIANHLDEVSTRERFEVFADSSENKNLFLNSGSILEERIMRGSYTMDMFDGQDVEFGMELAQTTLDSSLALGRDLSISERSAEFGDLVTVSIPNANTQVEEIRAEPFAIHNWRINPRMSLETSLVYEMSEITQSGDLKKQRDFQFFKPKIDYRFDVTPTLQMRMLVEKRVRQLAFSEFVASSDAGDEDEDTQAGNADMRPDYWWAYEFKTEYWLPDDMGVVSAEYWYHRHYDFRQRIDVSSATQLRSAWGNTGIGDMWIAELNASVRLSLLNMPNVLLNTTVSTRGSEVTDPLTGDVRGFNNYRKGRFSLGFRHDIPCWRMSYGVNFTDIDDRGYKLWDLEDIESMYGGPFGVALVEMVAFNDITFRLDSSNVTDEENCRNRVRFAGRRSANILEEVEYMCNGVGRVVSLRVSGTF